MWSNIGRATRTSALAALFVGIMMIAGPSLHLAGPDTDLSPVGSVAAGAGDRQLRVGWVSLSDNVKTLNPLKYTMGAEFILIWPCYSHVLSYDINDNVIGDLATEWSMSPDGLTWYFKIVNTAKFYDKNNPSVQVPLTVQDIIFTYNLVQTADGNYLEYYFPEIPGTGGKLIESMTAIGDYEMTIKLRARYAPFQSALTGIPILPKYIWEGQKWDWANFDTKKGIAPLIGSGQWYYMFDDLATIRSVNKADMGRSPTWFGIEEYGWKGRVDKLIWRSETTDSLVANYKSGLSDVIVGPTSTQYLDPGLAGVKWRSSQGFVFEFNMNQLTDENRDLYGIGKPTDYNNQLLLDPTIKLALQMSIDKQSFVDTVLLGLGTPADSLIPLVSPWHYTYGSVPDEDPILFDTQGARLLLYDAGWRYRLDGSLIEPGAGDYWTYYPLSKLGVTDTLSFRLDTPSSDTFFDHGTRMIRDWAREAGVDLVYGGAKNNNEMYNIWVNANYDTWLWDWWFVPTSEPAVDVMQVLSTEAIGSWSDVYWSNATYDALYYESLTEMDPVARKEIINDLQRMAYLHSGCWPVAYMDNLYVAQTIAPDRWTGWGDWTNYYALTVDNGYPWLFLQMYPGDPADNQPPVISGFTPSYDTTTTQAVTFTASVSDDNPNMEYRWNFGDGTKSSWTSITGGSGSAGATKTYAKDGYYDAYLMVREVGMLDTFYSWSKAVVKVIDLSNTAPRSLDFDYLPTDPDSGTIVEFSGTAIDDNPGDTLFYSWAFGDGHSDFGQTVTHQFSAGAGEYTVTMYVDDGHLGSEPRPVAYSRPVVVTANSPPSISITDYTQVQARTPWLFTATASDPDARDTLRFTWDWGDGTAMTVTTTPSAYHTYQIKKTYDLTVWADDLTDLPGHNVTATCRVTVTQTGNYAPTITLWEASSLSPLTGETVTFTGRGEDRDGDLLTVTFIFGDGNEVTLVQTERNQTLTADHVYEVVDEYGAYLRVSDGQAAPVTSSALWIDVLQGNRAPIVDELPDMVKDIYELVTFTAVASDPDGDPLTYTWDFGDGSELYVGGSTATHAYRLPSSEFGYVYWVHVSDGVDSTSEPGTIVVNVPSFTLNLVKGWNLMTVPFVGHSYMASTLGLSFGDAVYGYNSATRSYDRSYIMGISPSANDFAINPCEGYWVYAGGSRALVLSGEAPIGPQTREIVVPEGGGWVIIGIPSLDPNLHASDIPGMYTNLNISAVISWNAASGAWNPAYYPALPFTDFALAPGQGLFVWCTTSGTFTYDYY